MESNKILDRYIIRQTNPETYEIYRNSIRLFEGGNFESGLECILELTNNITFFDSDKYSIEYQGLSDREKESLQRLVAIFEIKGGREKFWKSEYGSLQEKINATARKIS